MVFSSALFEPEVFMPATIRQCFEIPVAMKYVQPPESKITIETSPLNLHLTSINYGIEMDSFNLSMEKLCNYAALMMEFMRQLEEKE